MTLRPGIHRLFRLGDGRPRDAQRDVTEEIQLHIDLRASELEASGMERSAARAEAARLFGIDTASMAALYDTALDRNRTMKMYERVESWMQDVTYAVRSLMRDRALALFVVLTLALGIGANITSFGIVDHLLVRGPAHVRDAHSLIRIYARTPNSPFDQETTGWIPFVTYSAMHAGMHSFSAIGAYGVRDAVVGRREDARKMRVALVTGGFLSMLGVQAMRGRLFGDNEDASATGRVALISENVWRDRYDMDPAVIGKTLQIGGEDHTIVGVLPRDFSGVDPKRVDVWSLISTKTARSVNWRPVGRLKPGITIAQAGAEADGAHKRINLETSHGATGGAEPKWFQSATLIAAPLHYGDTAAPPPETVLASWLAIVTCMILVIAFANVVNLMLVRLTRRRRELAIRVSLGCGRARVIRLVAIEGAILALSGGIASLLVARGVEPLVRNALFAGDASWSFTVDSRMLGMVLLFVVISAFIIGVGPAIHAGSPRVADALKSSARSGGGFTGIRNALTALQATLSVVLLIGAALFVLSMRRAHEVNLGVDPDKVVVATGDIPWTSNFTAAGFDDYAAGEVRSYTDAVNAVRRMPGVAHAAITVGLPLDGGSYSSSVYVQGADSVTSLPGAGPYASVVGADYFATVGTRILRGRAFTDADRAGAPRVIVINQTMARKLWPTSDALGSCVRIDKPDGECITVAGIAEDIHRVGLKAEPSMQYYLALGQPAPFAGANVLVRATNGFAFSWPQLRKVMLEAAPAINNVEVKRLSDSLNGEIRPMRLGELAFGLSGALALLVAALGLYSLMSYTVAWRTHEIGVRLALGASTGRITQLVVADGLRLAALGIVLGILITVIGGHWLEPQLFAIHATDPIAISAVALTLFFVAAIAAWVPAHRAVRISPTESLRAE